ncbi:methionyl-tRNA formyltransferase [Bacilli bacterium PM5-3]|nr:methionyl-tRNA formyltransferase [Bacilli bacterium PM5-3]MDH6603117.1 methionyl-tRNA formyltransferase [Bacilli bacterium PM5-9]
MKNKRILYMGTTSFSAYILEQLIISKFNIVGLVSQPDRRIGRKKEIKMTPTKEIALQNQIRVYGFENINDNYDVIKELEPDIIITCAYGQKINLDILEIPKYKSINVHASLLPKYRGGAPIHYAIINGEKETGNTIMYMEEGLDTGDIISQSKVMIDINDTTSTLSDKLMVDGANLLIKTLPDIFNDNIKAIQQDKNLVTYSHNIERSFEYIDFNREVIDVYNHMRGLIKIPGCYAILNDKKIKFHSFSFETTSHNLESGVIVVDSNEYFKIACINGFIKVFEFQLEGKKVVSFSSYRNGNKLEIVSDVVLNKGDNYAN